jgi:hypothetical protein
MYVLKRDFAEVDEEMFHCQRPCELIIRIMGIRRSELKEVANVVSSRQMALRTNYLTSGCLEM